MTLVGICKVTGIDVNHQVKLDGTDISLLFENPEEEVCRDVRLYWNTTYWGIPNMSMKYDDYTILATFTLPQNPEAGIMAWIKETKLHHFEVYNTKTDISQQHDLYPDNKEKYQYLVNKMVGLWAKVQAEGPEWPDMAPVKIKTLRKSGFDVPNF